MKRPLKPEDRHIWGVVAATVHPLKGRELPSPGGEGQPAKGGRGEAVRRMSAVLGDGPPNRPLTTPARTSSPGPLRGRPSPQGEGKGTAEGKGIEPNRRRRIAKVRDEIGARLDLHGLDQDRARATLEAFLRRAWDDGYRAVLVITGKGVKGDGILRRRTPEWLAAPHLAPIVAGISEAQRHHGGEGALYVALKRKPRG